MPEFGTAFSGMKADRKLTHSELVRAIRFMIAAEYEAVQIYVQLAESIDNQLAKEVLMDIADEEKVHACLEKITDTCIEQGCIPYKTPTWMTEKMREKINPGWLELFDKVKKCMDPNNIFNPGRWNT